MLLISTVDDLRIYNCPMFRHYRERNLIKLLSFVNITGHRAAEYNAITCGQEVSADCAFAVIEGANAHGDRESNPGLMDCGRKIDRLTINVIVLRGAIRRDGIVVRRIAMQRAADSVHLLVRMKYRTAFSVTGRIASASKFRLGLADCESRSWDRIAAALYTANNWSLMINPAIHEKEKSVMREDTHFSLRQHRQDFLHHVHRCIEFSVAPLQKENVIGHSSEIKSHEKKIHIYVFS